MGFDVCLFIFHHTHGTKQIILPPTYQPQNGLTNCVIDQLKGTERSSGHISVKVKFSDICQSRGWSVRFINNTYKNALLNLFVLLVLKSGDIFEIRFLPQKKN